MLAGKSGPYNVAVADYKAGQASEEDGQLSKADDFFAHAVKEFSSISGKNSVNRTKALLADARVCFKLKDFWRSFIIKNEALRILATNPKKDFAP